MRLDLEIEPANTAKFVAPRRARPSLRLSSLILLMAGVTLIAHDVRAGENSPDSEDEHPPNHVKMHQVDVGLAAAGAVVFGLSHATALGFGVAAVSVTRGASLAITDPIGGPLIAGFITAGAGNDFGNFVGSMLILDASIQAIGASMLIAGLVGSDEWGPGEVTDITIAPTMPLGLNPSGDQAPLTGMTVAGRF